MSKEKTNWTTRHIGQWVQAVIFDLDGVVTNTADPMPGHGSKCSMTIWRPWISERVDRNGASIARKTTCGMWMGSRVTIG
jgi:hypothetical protein